MSWSKLRSSLRDESEPEWEQTRRGIPPNSHSHSTPTQLPLNSHLRSLSSLKLPQHVLQLIPLTQTHLCTFAPRAMKKDAITSIPASNCAPRVSTVGNTENHSPAHGGNSCGIA